MLFRSQQFSILKPGGFIELGQGCLQIGGQFFRFGSIGRKQQFIDVLHLATHFLHGAVDEIAGEHPVAGVHQASQFGQAITGLQKAFGLAGDAVEGVLTEGGGCPGASAFSRS